MLCQRSEDSVDDRVALVGTVAAGDPRRSLEERYKTHDCYVQAVAKAAKKLEKKRLLLQEDVEKYIQAAESSDILK